MMKKALLSLLLAFVSVPALFAQAPLGFAMQVDTVSDCQTYRWPRNNQQYSRDTVVVHTIADTTYVLYFTKMPSYIDTAKAIELNGDCSVSWNEKVYSQMGTFLDTLTAISGCDSIVKLSITLASIDTVKTITKCGSYTAPWGDVYTESAIIDTTVVNGECTYHNILTLNLHPEYVNLDTLEVTAGCSYRWNDTTLTDTLVHTKVFKTVEGQCDSIVSIHVTAYSGQQSDTVPMVVCDKYKPTWHDTITVSGIYAHDTTYGTYLADTGLTACLHHDAIDLTVIQSISDSAAATITTVDAGCSYTWNGETYTPADTGVLYYQYTSVIGGCDSMAAIRINFSNHNYDTTFARYCGATYNWKTSCPSLPLPGADNLYNYTNDTLVTVPDTVGSCITDYTLNLTFFTKADTVADSACGFSFSFNYQRFKPGTQQIQSASTSFTTSGYHSVAENGDTMLSIANGTLCKTYKTLNLKLVNPDQRTRAHDIDTAVCESFSFKLDGKTFTFKASSSNNNELIIDSTLVNPRHTSTKRCYDSIAHIHLVIHRNSFIERNATACDSYKWEEFDGKTYTQSGTYRDTLDERTADGCLRIGRLTLVINKTPEVSIDGNWILSPGESTLLKAVLAEGSDAISNYKWYVDDVLRASGSTADSLLLDSVQRNTEVRMEATSVKNCSTTKWLTITANVGIDEVETLQVNIYPNPASRYVNIESASALSEVVIYNTIGQQAVRRTVNGNAVQLDLGHLATGTYTLRISGADGSLTTRKIIVNK